MDVNFFRFPFVSRSGGGEGGNRREPQAEQPRPLKEILEDVKSALRLLSYPDPKYNYNKYKYLRANRQSPQKNILLGEIQSFYVELGSYEEYELARKTREELLKILEENGRSP